MIDQFLSELFGPSSAAASPFNPMTFAPNQDTGPMAVTPGAIERAAGRHGLSPMDPEPIRPNMVRALSFRPEGNPRFPAGGFPPAGDIPMPRPKPELMGAPPMAAPMAPPMDRPNPILAQSGPLVPPGMTQPGGAIDQFGGALARSDQQQPRGDIMSRLTSPEFLRRVRSSLGGGLSAMKNSPFAGQAFASGMGGALKGGTDREDTEFAQQGGLLDRLLKVNAGQADTAYKGALTNQSGALADLYRARSSPEYMKSGGVTAGREGATERIIRALRLEDPSLSTAEALQLARRAPSGDTNALRREKLALDAAKGDRDYFSKPDATLEKWRKKYGLGEGTVVPVKPVAPADSKPAATKGAEISMDGDGTQGAPYKPKAQVDYDEIPSGSYYIHPGNDKIPAGTMVRKK